MADQEIRATPSEAEVLKRVIDSRIAQINTALPGRIESYDASRRVADVQPMLKRKFKDGTVEDYPVIVNVPIVWLTAFGGKVIISSPVKKGDGCLLLFAQRSLDAWATTGRMVEPPLPHKYDLSDGIAIVGLQASDGSQTKADPNDLLIMFDKVQIRLQPGNKVAIGIGGIELLDLLDQTLLALTRAFTLTLLGNQPLSEAINGTFATIQSKLAQIKGKL